MAIRPVAAQLFHADGRTDMTKLIVAFRTKAYRSIKTRNHDTDTKLISRSCCSERWKV